MGSAIARDAMLEQNGNELLHAAGALAVSDMSPPSSGRTLFFFEKPSAMRQLQRFFRSPNTVCVAAEGHLLSAEEPGTIRPEWKPWRFDALPIKLATIPVGCGMNRSGQSHEPKITAIRQALSGVERVIIATDPRARRCSTTHTAWLSGKASPARRRLRPTSPPAGAFSTLTLLGHSFDRERQIPVQAEL